MRHRIREQLAGQRTALLNALRGHLSEIGVIAPQGAQHAYRLKRLVAGEADDNGEIVVCEPVRVALAPLLKQVDALDEAIPICRPCSRVQRRGKKRSLKSADTARAVSLLSMASDVNCSRAGLKHAKGCGA